MKTRNKKRITGIIALALIFVIAVTAALYFAAFFSPATHSVDLTATVSGDIAGGVDVYISGDGVTRDEDGKYTIPSGTDVEITVINNTAVSSELIVNGTSSDTYSADEITDNFARVTNVTSDLTIEVNGTLATEEGTSLFTAYELSESEDFLALSKILAAKDRNGSIESDVTSVTLPTIVNYLAKFGFDDESWYTTDESGNIVTDESGNTILNDQATISKVQSNLITAKAALSTAYFRLADDVMLNQTQSGETTITTGYFGLGSRRGSAFQGVFDFDGYAVTLNMDIPSVSTENFTEVQADNFEHNILSAGLFNYIYGNGEDACAILGADVRGTISLTSGELSDIKANSDDYRIYLGGVAGSIGKNVVLDGVSSSVSISAQTSTKNTPISVYAGGVFGFSGADIDYWSNVSYTGNYSEISVTSSSGAATLPARTVVGALAGVIQNAYVNNFTANLRGANILADSTSYGNAVAGGLAGIIFASSNAYEETNGLSANLHIRGININASGSTVSALTASKSDGRTIDPDSVFVVEGGKITSADAAIAGGLIGRVYATNIEEDDFETLYISEIDFGAVSGSDAFTIRAGTANSSSRALTFAGGVVGYVSTQSNAMNVSYNPEGEAITGGEGDAVIFSNKVVINSVQNGIGPAYAGGIFGYNAFALPTDGTPHTFTLTGENGSVSVTAEQTAETTYADTLYDVCAGLFTSVLPDNYSINSFTFNASNSTATARRLAGSTAVGDIAAGAIAGKANGNGGGNNSAVIQNLTVDLDTCSINAFGYSFDSKYTTGQGNNVYAGGVIGYVRNYGDYDNNNQNNNIGLNNIKITFDRSLNNSDYAVYGIQNAEVPSNSSDYWSEGYVGGMFGMMESGYATNLTVDGTVKDRTVIYFNSTNDPNTASVGGLIGATRNLRNDNGTDVRDDSYAVKNSSVTDVHVAGRAYSGTQDDGWRWDIYVGGAIGVFGTANKSGNNGLSGYNYVSGITVEHSSIEAIGDEAMLTYAGGVFGGVWWVSSATVSDCVSRDNSVLASSATFNTFAGGIAGMIQNANSSITDSLVLNTNVEAITYSEDTTVANSNVKAYAAGICARVYQGSALQNNISNATVSASAVKLGDSYTVIAGIGILNDGGYSWLEDNNSIREGGPSDYYFSSTDTYINNYFVTANSNKDIADLSVFMGIEGQDIYQYGERNWYLLGYNVENVQSLNNYAIALKGSGQGHITMPSDGEPLEHTMSVNGTFNVYDGLGLSSNEGDIAGRRYKVNIVGNGDFTLNGLTFTPNKQGTYYAQILVDGELLCSYPIIVENPSTSNGVTITTPDFTMPSADGTTTNAYVNAQNSHNFWSSAFGNSTQVDFSKLNSNQFGTGQVQNVGGGIFTVIGSHGNDEIGTEHDTADITHLYFRNQAPENAKKTSELTSVIQFEAKSSGTLIINAITNNDDKDIHPILYKVDGDTITKTEYADLDSKIQKDFSIKIEKAGTYYVGFRGNGCRIYTINLVYDGDNANKANSGTTYFQIYAGDLSYVQNVIVSNSNVYMPQIYLVRNSGYLLGYVDGAENNNIYTSEQIKAKATQITQNLGSASSITGVMNFFNVSTTDDGKGLNISPVLGNTEGAALVLRYTTGQDEEGNDIYYYVIIEVVPNAIVELSIAPAADTPPRATTTDENGEKIYIYAAGSDDRPETVRLEAEVTYRFPYNRFIVDVKFEKADGSTSASTVQPNGTVVVAGSSGQTVVVSCSPISGGGAIENIDTPTLTIQISNAIQVVAGDMSGTSYAPVSDNDAVAGYPFSFTLDPNPGYGLNPELTIELQRANGNNYTNIMSFDITLPQKRADGEAGEITYVYNGSTYTVTETAAQDEQTGVYTYSATLTNISISNFVLTYQYNVSTGVYTITLPADLFKVSGLSQVTINASFQKVYSIMFDLGEWADDIDGAEDNGGVGSRYFIYQVKNGEAINSTLYNNITSALSDAFAKTNSRQGFTFKGFYTTTSANTLSSYGTSFKDMFEKGDASSKIRGSMNFYARWNYTIALHAPSGVGIVSGLSSVLLERQLKGGSTNNIIPIDTRHGFSFALTGTYVGTPRVEVYTVGEGGRLVPLEITNINGVYTVNNPDLISGTIHIYVYADNLTLAVSDTPDATQAAIDLRKDGIFTARYTVNYPGGVDADKGHAQSIVFNFGSVLPVGTRMRLFYHANGSKVAVGYYEVDENSKFDENGATYVEAVDFEPLTGSDSSETKTIFALDDNEILTSESLYLVVTLPNNDDTTFKAIDNLVISVSSYNATLDTPTYETKGVTYDGTDGTSKVQKVTEENEPENSTIKATVNLFNIVHRYGNPNGNTLTFAENDPYANTETAAPEDVRHADKYYVWRIAKNDWTADMVDSGVSYVTTDVYIYVAASNSLSGVDSGDDIVLMEVTNTQYPAAGAVVWTNSGN